MTESQFWLHKPLKNLSHEEWESLCDGCAKCCLHRLEDEETREIHCTNVCCRYLEQERGECRDYPNRSTNVPDCLNVTLELLKDPYWLPTTCAYRLLSVGKRLPWWHPLVSGSKDTLIESGNSVGGRVICETDADGLEHHLIDWVN